MRRTPTHALRILPALAVVLALAGVLTVPAKPAAAAPAMKNVLFYGPTSGGLADLTPGINATTWDEATWATKTTADFAAFDAIVFGDEPACGVTRATWTTAVANRSVWSAAISGNVTVNGTDPDFHSKPQFVQQSVLFAASGHGTGLYVSLSCAYHTTAEAPVPVDVLGGIGTFMTQSVGTSFCPVNAHIVAGHPSLGGLDDAYMSGWSCSAHEGFTQWPANFSPLVIITDASTNPYTASDGTHGLVYVLASGARTAGLSLTPRSASAVPGSAHTVIARQADSSDAPQAGVTSASPLPPARTQEAPVHAGRRPASATPRGRCPGPIRGASAQARTASWRSRTPMVTVFPISVSHRPRH